MGSVAVKTLRWLFCFVAVATTAEQASAMPVSSTGDGAAVACSSENQSRQDTSLWSILNPWSAEAGTDSTSFGVALKDNHTLGGWVETQGMSAPTCERVEECRRLALIGTTHLFCDAPQAAGAGASSTSMTTHVSPGMVSKQAQSVVQSQLGFVGRESNIFRPAPFLAEIFHPPRASK
jgi:hypothetical protein